MNRKEYTYRLLSISFVSITIGGGRFRVFPEEIRGGTVGEAEVDGWSSKSFSFSEDSLITSFTASGELLPLTGDDVPEVVGLVLLG